MGGDVIVAADGKAVATIDELRDVIGAHKPGDKIELKIYRGDDGEDRHRHARAATDDPLPVAARGRPLLSGPATDATRPPAHGCRGPRRVGRLAPAPRPRPVVIVRAVSEDEKPERGSLLLDEEQLVEDEELWEDDGSGDYIGWFCVRTDPFPCPAPGCTFVAEHMTAAHLVLVWEERDDPNLLWHAQRAKEVGRNPRVVSYERSFGPSASYYAWEAAGRPVHGVRGKV